MPSLVLNTSFLRLAMTWSSTLLMKSVCSRTHSHLTYLLIIHWKILLLQILNSRFMIIRFDYLLNSTWKWSLLRSFLFWIRNYLLGTHFGCQTLTCCVLSNIIWGNLYCTMNIFGCLISSLWAWFTNTLHRGLMDFICLTLTIGISGSNSLISRILHSLSIYLCFGSLV